MKLSRGRSLPTRTVSLLLAGALAATVPLAGIGTATGVQPTAEAATAQNQVYAKQSKAQAKADLAEAQKEFDAAQERANTAKAALEKAKVALETAETDLASKEKAQTDASAAKEAAKNAYEAAQNAPVKYSTLDFFKAMGSTNATNALTNSRYASSTDFTKRGDATNAAMVRKSLDYLDQFNELRTSIGLSQLKVTDYMMATAEADVNWSRTHIAHAQQFNVGENLAWNYSDPFKGWYDAEKAFYDSGNRTYSEIGHYLNIIDRSYKSTGFATARGGLYGGYTTGQTFHYIENAGGPAYTVAQWRERFEDWVKSAGDDGQAEIDAAQEAYEKAVSACDEAETARDAAAEARSTAASALEEAQYDYESAASNLEDAQKSLSRAQKALEKLGGDSAAGTGSSTATVPALNVKTVTAASVDAAVAGAGERGKAATAFALGAKTKTISKSAFAGQKQIRVLVVESKKLTKNSVRGSLKGSGVTTVEVQVSSSTKTNAKYVKKYKKIFTKKIAGKKAKVTG